MRKCAACFCLGLSVASLFGAVSMTWFPKFAFGHWYESEKKLEQVEKWSLLLAKTKSVSRQLKASGVDTSRLDILIDIQIACGVNQRKDILSETAKELVRLSSLITDEAAGEASNPITFRFAPTATKTNWR